jgi:hypothetical protein
MPLKHEDIIPLMIKRAIENNNLEIENQRLIY